MSVVTKRHLRILLGILGGLVFVLAVAALVVVWFLQRDPAGLARKYADELEAATGLEFRFESVAVQLLPLPSLAVGNATVEGRGLHFSVAYATVFPDFLALLGGVLKPQHVEFLRPRVSLRGGASLGQLLLSENSGGGEDAALGMTFPIPKLLDGCHFVVTDGEASLTAGEASVRVDGLRCGLKVTGHSGLSGRVRLTRGELDLPGLPAIAFRDIEAEGKSDIGMFWQKTPWLNVKGRLSIDPWLAWCDVDARLKGTTGAWGITGALVGDFRKDAAQIPFMLRGGVSRSAPAAPLALEKLQLKLGGDLGELNGRLALPADGQSLADARLDGHLYLPRFSLTHWLGFARGLSPGLQLALDDLTEGSLFFSIDGHGLTVPEISVQCSGSNFSGRGGVPDWKAPVVFLDMASPRVNLCSGIPEACGEMPEAPRFTHGAFTPQKATPYKEGDIDIGYDIRLGANFVDYGPLLVENAHVVIHPGLRDAGNGYQDSLIDADGQMYQGSLKGQCILGGAPELPYAITLDVRNVDGAGLSRDMPVLPPRSGQWRASLNIASQGRDLEPFLRQLRGTAAVSGSQGSLQLPGGTRLPFGKIQAGLDLRGAAWKDRKLGFDGQWKGQLETSALSAGAELSGRMWFGGDGSGGGAVDMRQLPGSVYAAMKQGQLAGQRIEVRGSFSCQADKGELSVTKAHATGLGVEATGDVTFRNSRNGRQYQGKADFQVTDLDRTLRLLGKNPSVPASWNRLMVAGDFRMDADTFALSNMRGKVDKSNITGNVSYSPKSGSNVSLVVDNLDLEALTGKKGGASSKPGLWDFRSLVDVRSSGLVELRRLRVFKAHLTDVRLPYALEKGKLSIPAGTARFYEGPVNAKTTVSFGKGLHFETNLTMQGANLSQMSAERATGPYIGGRGDLTARISGNLTEPGKIAARLNGTWGCTVRDGSYCKRASDGKPVGKPIRFDLARATGELRSGVLSSRDFLMQGSGLKVTGQGKVDFARETLDCNFDVDMKNVPEFPMRLYGTFDDSKTSIGAGQLILNAIGGVGQGVIDVFGGIISGAGRLFTPKKN